MAAGEEGRGDLLEVRAHRREGLVEAALDRFRQLGAELLQLLQARFEVGALVGQLGQPLLLVLVLLLGKRVDLTERLAAPLEPLDPGRELLPVLTFAGLGSGLLETTPRLARFGLEARALDVDPTRALARLCGDAPDLGLLAPEPAQLRGQLARLRGPGVHASAEGRLEALDCLGSAGQRGRQPLGEDDQRLKRHRRRLRRKLLGSALEVLDLLRKGATAGVELEEDRLGRLS